MYERLRSNIEEKVPLTEAEWQLCKSLFSPKKLRKKQYFLQEGDVCRYTAFIEKGAMRSYSIDEKGNEHIIQFGLEGWWITDLYSFYTNEPSTYTIDALEDSEILQITQPNYEELMKQVPVMERYFRILLQNRLIAMQRRLSGNLSLSAEQKYRWLLQAHPDIFQRVPQHMIASYLGITKETLSRIRGRVSNQKP
ncbi:MAG TPA: cyclic nucleotide-binding protein [Chitinophagaceae bacterium]|nr:cyclic nucleotide-binding protein [Chitinophagaceae bacterium]HCY90162.1 cyclic nucleotide-binding protein [Chitinophagaceae bacterium]HRF26485.1 Crp/Fnr family transcriptional regulator [Ferruginibacter sp.]